MRLIDADALTRVIIKSIYELTASGKMKRGSFEAGVFMGYLEVINAAPTIDAEPTKHGEWNLLDECANAGVYCSNCHKKVYKENYANQKLLSNYCPNCGAVMAEGLRKL